MPTLEPLRADEFVELLAASLISSDRPSPTTLRLNLDPAAEELAREVAAAAGVNVQTLRNYEGRGLLAEPERSLGGQRLYPTEEVTLLQVIEAA